MSRYIDADFEIAHYTSMTTNPTPDVTEIDKINSLVILDALRMAKTIDIVRCKCDFGKCHEQGDTLYESSDWDGGIGFDYIRDIKYCPLCGGLLDGEEQTERRE